MLARIIKEQAGGVYVLNQKKKQKKHAETVALISLLATAAKICLWKLLPQLWGLVKHWAACTGRPLASLSKAPKRESNFFSQLIRSCEFLSPPLFHSQKTLHQSSPSTSFTISLALAFWKGMSKRQRFSLPPSKLSAGEVRASLTFFLICLLRFPLIFPQDRFGGWRPIWGLVRGSSSDKPRSSPSSLHPNFSLLLDSFPLLTL